MMKYWTVDGVNHWYARVCQLLVASSKILPFANMCWSSWSSYWKIYLLCLMGRKKGWLTGTQVLRFVHVSSVIAIPTTTEGGSFDSGAAIGRTLLTQSWPLEWLKGALRTSCGGKKETWKTHKNQRVTQSKEQQTLSWFASRFCAFLFALIVTHLVNFVLESRRASRVIIGTMRLTQHRRGFSGDSCKIVCSDKIHKNILCTVTQNHVVLINWKLDYRFLL